MKKYVLNVAVITVLALAGSSSSASAQIYVNVHPAWHSVRRPPPPSPRHVWIEEDWTMRGGKYVSTGGHWATPPRPGYVWFPGRWEHSRRGDRWVAGRWGRH
jgi:hypothetical protein